MAEPATDWDEDRCFRDHDRVDLGLHVGVADAGRSARGVTVSRRSVDGDEVAAQLRNYRHRQLSIRGSFQSHDGDVWRPRHRPRNDAADRGWQVHTFLPCGGLVEYARSAENRRRRGADRRWVTGRATRHGRGHGPMPPQDGVHRSGRPPRSIPGTDVHLPQGRIWHIAPGLLRRSVNSLPDSRDRGTRPSVAAPDLHVSCRNVVASLARRLDLGDLPVS
jgi:hypothetical protein